jgi:hypothetical protein
MKSCGGSRLTSTARGGDGRERRQNEERHGHQVEDTQKTGKIPRERNLGILVPSQKEKILQNLVTP